MVTLVFVGQSESSSLSHLCRMSFNDFLRHYSRIELCTLTPDTIEDDSVKHWSVSKFDGTWRRGSTAGGCRNNPCKFCYGSGTEGTRTVLNSENIRMSPE